MFSFWKQSEKSSSDSAKLSKEDLKEITRLQNNDNNEEQKEITDEPSLQVWQPDFNEKKLDEKSGQLLDAESSADEIEKMYQQALDTLETVEQEIGFSLPDEDDKEQSNVQQNERQQDEQLPAADSPKEEIPDEENPSRNNIDRVAPEQILEAALFVGGVSLTTKKLKYLLQESFDSDFIESTIAQLNERYRRENRPYEILFGEGGYRMTLCQKHERVRIRAFGMGPKEVKLSQDALETLAVVAYKQPISKKEIEALGKKKPTGTINQLLRRELIALERNDENPKEVKYLTTPRFLQLFGLKNSSELPTAEDIEFK
ncbi:Segregation and condensation protein B [hydrothermal vent metagenome]|uniref:Segregation and condensation protein B n=1 Tax=hydrothermal vent metagenome TaxID=652676 RepID=A0A3B1DNT9_9ZZZZ